MPKSAKDAATSFVEALGDTFTQLGETLDRTFRERRPTKVNVEVEETEPQATEESSESEEPEA